MRQKLVYLLDFKSDPCGPASLSISLARLSVSEDRRSSFQERDLDSLLRGNISYLTVTDYKIFEILKKGIRSKKENNIVLKSSQLLPFFEFAKDCSLKTMKGGSIFYDGEFKELKLIGEMSKNSKNEKISFVPTIKSSNSTEILESTESENTGFLSSGDFSGTPIILGEGPYWLYSKNVLYKLNWKWDVVYLARCSKNHSITFSEFKDKFPAWEPGCSLPITIPEKYQTEARELTQFTTVIRVAEGAKALNIAYEFSYHPEVTPCLPGNSSEPSFTAALKNGELVKIVRNFSLEEKMSEKFEDSFKKLPESMQGYLGGKTLGKTEGLLWVSEIREHLPSHWKIDGIKELKEFSGYRLQRSWRMEVLNQNVVITPKFVVEELPVSVDDVVKRVSKMEIFLPIKTKIKAVFPTAWTTEFLELFALITVVEDKWIVKPFYFKLLEKFIKFEKKQIEPNDYERVLSFLKSSHSDEIARVTLQASKPLTPSPKISGEIQTDSLVSIRDICVPRKYQEEGIGWLGRLSEFQIGALLADDMGLGKTLQVINHLANLVNRNQVKSILAVLPVSLVHNWKKEIDKWCEGFEVIPYSGKYRKVILETGFKHKKKPTIYLATYRIVLNDQALFATSQFDAIILDEAQNVKNPDSASYKAVCGIAAKYRIAITGTPVENSLLDLWSHMNFLNPGVLGNKNWFRERFIKEGSEEKLATLKSVTGSLMLRRTKELVAKDLPDLEENIVYIQMNEDQQNFYDQIREQYHEKISSSIKINGLENSKLLIVEGLLRLRQICCHPQLTKLDNGESSAKLNTLVSMVEECVEEGHKVLLFSQFTSMLALVESALHQVKIKTSLLTGKTPEEKRVEEIERFQVKNETKVFLISLKAGGTGLNLTAADYVIHIDPWWNPAAEAQATARSHRIGQKNKVISYKLITEGSVEERVLELQNSKKLIAKEMGGDESAIINTLTPEMVKKLFSKTSLI